MPSPENKISIEVQLVAADLDELWRNAPINYLRWILIVLGVWCSYCTFAYWVNGFSPFVVIEWLLVSLLALLGGGFLLHLRMRQIFRRSPSLRQLRRYTLSPNGVSYESQLMNCDMQWPALSAIREGRRAFVLYFSAYVAGIVLPKRSFSSSEQIQEFKQLAQNSFNGKIRFRG